jgi:hypothetical protein
VDLDKDAVALLIKVVERPRECGLGPLLLLLARAQLRLVCPTVQGFRVQGSGFQGTGFRISGYRVLGFCVKGSGFQGTGFRVSGTDFRATPKPV